VLTNETVDELESISDRPQEIISVLPSKGEVEASMRRVAGAQWKEARGFEVNTGRAQEIGRKENRMTTLNSVLFAFC
jgi:hypothetical protein